MKLLIELLSAIFKGIASLFGGGGRTDKDDFLDIVRREEGEESYRMYKGMFNE